MKTLRKALAALLIAGITFSQSPANLTSAENPALPLDDRAFMTAITPVSVTFQKMGFTGATFEGPYGMTGFAFNLPDDWLVDSGSSIHLKYTVRMPDIEKSKALATGRNGYLYVHMNYTQLTVIPLRSSGDFEIDIPISLSVAPPLSDGSNEIEFVFKNDDACIYDNGITVYISPESTINIKPILQSTAPKLSALPRPFFYENNVVAGFHTTMVVPDKPTAQELQAALAVAAGFGSLARGALDISLVTEKGLTDTIKMSDHLIFVGKLPSLPTVRKLVLLTPLNSNSGFQSGSISKTDGVVQFTNSPWNASRDVLLVSGDTDEAVLKAGQSIRTKTVTRWGNNGLVVIKSVSAILPAVIPTPETAPEFFEKTFTDLGYKDNIVSGLGSFQLDYYFNVPARSVGKDSYLKLDIKPSAGVSLPQSLINISLNDNPISNILLGKTEQDRQTVRVDIPAAWVRPGKNHIAISMQLNANNRCDNKINAYGNLKKQLWTMTVYADSLIHIAFGSGQKDDENIAAAAGLASYGEELAYTTSLENLAFILPPDEPATWEAAARIALKLGNKSNITKIEKGPVLLHMFFASPNLTSEVSAYDIVTAQKDANVGIPSGGSTRDLSDEPVIRSYDSPVTYHLLPGVSVGKVELTDSTWNPDHRMLVLTGNDDGGLTLAADALVLSKYVGFLTGSSVVTNGSQIVFDNP
jgi:hypothetical protein